MAALAREFFEHTIDRHYLALVWGDFKEDHGTVTGNIGRSLKDRKVMDVFADPETGKHAVTHYEVVERFGYVTLIRCKLETGRTHQIRVHLAHVGFPIAGDDKYGDFAHNKELVRHGLKRMFLHASSVTFLHPVEELTMSVEAPLPPELQKFVAQLDNENAAPI